MISLHSKFLHHPISGLILYIVCYIMENSINTSRNHSNCSVVANPPKLLYHSTIHYYELPLQYYSSTKRFDPTILDQYCYDTITYTLTILPMILANKNFCVGVLHSNGAKIIIVVGIKPSLHLRSLTKQESYMIP